MNVVACIPYFGMKDLAHDDCVAQLKGLGVPVIERRNWPYIDQVRSLLVEDARDAGADVLVFIDHDILFGAADVLKLGELALAEHAVIGAVYARKAIGGNIVGAFEPGQAQVTLYEGGGLYPAVLVGMGFTAIPLAALTVLDELPVVMVPHQRAVRPYFLPMIDGGHYLGEDVSFCRRFRAAGGRLLIDTRIRILHRGACNFDVAMAATPPQTAPRSIVVDLEHRS